MTGFYLMHRGWMDNDVFRNKPYSERDAWVWMIEAAAWKPTQHRVGLQMVDVDRGQFITSVRGLAEQWQWTKDRVHRFLKLLQECNMIRAESATGKDKTRQRITICNYTKFQDPRAADETDVATDTRQARDSGATLKKEGKEDNKTYLFAGRVIRLTERDHAAWRAECPNLDEAAFRRELIKCDAYLADNSEGAGKWFFRAKRWMLTADERAAEEKAKAAALTRPRWNAPTAKDVMRARAAGEVLQ